MCLFTEDPVLCACARLDRHTMDRGSNARISGDKDGLSRTPSPVLAFCSGALLRGVPPGQHCAFPKPGRVVRRHCTPNARGVQDFPPEFFGSHPPRCVSFFRNPLNPCAAHPS